ncbi:hypothetical protein V2J09_022502 [Rumex salicifolius]
MVRGMLAKQKMSPSKDYHLLKNPPSVNDDETLANIKAKMCRTNTAEVDGDDIFEEDVPFHVKRAMSTPKSKASTSRQERRVNKSVIRGN